MKKLLSATAVLFLLGCGSGEQNQGTTNEGGKGTGGDGQGGTGAGTGDGGSGGTGAGVANGGAGGAGGASDGGGGSAPTACAPGSYEVTLTLKDTTVAMTEPCVYPGPGPDAQVFVPKGGGASFVVDACSGPSMMAPTTSMTTDLTGAGTGTVALTYSDGVNVYAVKDASITIDAFGDVFGVVSGTMDGTLVNDGGELFPMTGTFHLCRRPDLLAP